SCSTPRPRCSPRPTRLFPSPPSSRTRISRPRRRSTLPSRSSLVTELFRLMLLQRTFEERTWMLYRQGRISGSMYDGLGQEAVAAAAGLALEDGDVVAPLNRELATHFARGVTPADAFRNFLGRGDGPTFGRDGNMHFGVPTRGVNVGRSEEHTSELQSRGHL